MCYCMTWFPSHHFYFLDLCIGYINNDPVTGVLNKRTKRCFMPSRATWLECERSFWHQGDMLRGLPDGLHDPRLLFSSYASWRSLKETTWDCLFLHFMPLLVFFHTMSNTFYFLNEDFFKMVGAYVCVRSAVPQWEPTVESTSQEFLQPLWVKP